MAFGYTGKILNVDLTTSKIEVTTFDEKFMRKYYGGKAFIAHILLKELPENTEPLSEDNILVFATGLLTGMPIAGVPRFVVGAKSPLTGGFGQSEAGGFWGPELKKAGYDAIVVKGKAQKPVYLAIDDDQVTIKDGQSIWGLETGEAQDEIQKELGSKYFRVLQIGPAGENLVRYACILNNLKHANGRNGLGAVMGSKNLRAIAVLGSKKIEVADSEGLRAIGKDFLSYYMDNPLTRGLYEYGTNGALVNNNVAGILPTKNFINGEFDQAENISAERMNETILTKREGCYACAVRCKRRVEIDRDDLNVNGRYGGPEYETVASFGSLIENGDLNIIAKANELCNRYAMDTISTGMSIAFALEAKENGFFKEYDELDDSKPENILKLIEKIAKREGIGEILAEGSYRAAEILGEGAYRFVQTVKGQELAMHDPRGKVGVGLGYALSETGADHMIIGHDTMFNKEGFTLESMKPLGITKAVDALSLEEDKVEAFVKLQHWWSFFNMAGICDFVPAPRGSMPIEDLVKLVQTVSGWDVTLDEIVKAGERSINMARLFNLRQGLTYADDTLPDRLFEGIGNGRQKGTKIDRRAFEKAIKNYYTLAGWDEKGIPLEEKLKALEINY